MTYYFYNASLLYDDGESQLVSGLIVSNDFKTPEHHWIYIGEMFIGKQKEDGSKVTHIVVNQFNRVQE